MLTIHDLQYQLLLGLVCTTFAFVTGIAVMKQLSPFTVVLAVNLEPVYTIAIALLIWEGERMHTGSYAGIALILLCLFANGLLQRRERQKQEATSIAFARRTSPMSAVSCSSSGSACSCSSSHARSTAMMPQNLSRTAPCCWNRSAR